MIESIELSAFYADYIDNSNKIQQVAKQIDNINTTLCKGGCVSGKDLHLIFLNIECVLENWTGNTYVGRRKEKELRDAYQSFYEALYVFILGCRRFPDKKFQQFAKEVLYQGTLYRYLGHGDCDKRNEPIDIEYNDIWVSWSKNKEISYIENKLYGKKIRLQCDTGDDYGIDLKVFGVVKPNEAEVVFPTIKKNIKNIEILERK